MTQPFNVGDIVCLAEWSGKTAKVLLVKPDRKGRILLDRPLDGHRRWAVQDLKHALPVSDGETN